jgi:hypothetical protein
MPNFWGVGLAMLMNRSRKSGAGTARKWRGGGRGARGGGCGRGGAWGLLTFIVIIYYPEKEGKRISGVFKRAG